MCANLSKRKTNFISAVRANAAQQQQRVDHCVPPGEGVSAMRRGERERVRLAPPEKHSPARHRSAQWCASTIVLHLAI